MLDQERHRQPRAVTGAKPLNKSAQNALRDAWRSANPLRLKSATATGDQHPNLLEKLHLKIQTDSLIQKDPHDERQEPERKLKVASKLRERSKGGLPLRTVSDDAEPLPELPKETK